MLSTDLRPGKPTRSGCIRGGLIGWSTCSTGPDYAELFFPGISIERRAKARVGFANVPSWPVPATRKRRWPGLRIPHRRRPMGTDESGPALLPRWAIHPRLRRATRSNNRLRPTPADRGIEYGDAETRSRSYRYRLSVLPASWSLMVAEISGTPQLPEVQTKQRFARATNIALDSSDPSRLPDYRFSTNSQQLLVDVLDAYAGSRRDRAWSVVGPYGSGKSIFGTF